MSLRELFGEEHVNDMMTAWPTKPAVSELPADSRLPGIANAQLLHAYLDTGTAPADDIIVIKDSAALHPRAYTTASRLDPAKLAKWRGRGYTVQLRNINRWCPLLHSVCAAIQTETGYGCHVTGFVTPAGGQGLNHHWDQNMGFIYQVTGRKTWQIWEPAVEEPHRDHLACNTRPGSNLVRHLKGTRPDHDLALEPGQVLVLPRGWMHNAHARDQKAASTHLTFVVRERTGLWIGEQLTKTAITSTSLRRVIPPANVVNLTAFAEQVDQARHLLMHWLAHADEATLAADLLDRARTERDVDYA
ncbi:cupin domain-containing protein [Jidongwangia harbinensis]|uniref:cupin domain-containing protein n=1 Tax=Jidongwangia harbinensis TaxID=2878561 RepID=UPI001CD96962|nr:cupin domain-containing protein [Jidongwangia harbinensis]MCA2216288.1 cupin domain-containing protein [Jidongwangia harbinensis]MCA2217023.1 cupin domain-containing protein [Jidongwangia harbinensis]